MFQSSISGPHCIELLKKESYLFDTLPSEAEELIPLRIAHEIWGPNFTRPPSRSRHGLLAYLIAGQGMFESEQYRVALKPGMLFTFGPDAPHAFACDRRATMELYIVTFHGRHAERFYRERLNLNCYAGRHANPQALTNVLEQMLQVKRTLMRHATEICQHYLYILLRILEAGLLEKPPLFGPAEQSFAACRDLIDRDYESLNSVQEVAARAHLHPAYLTRLFQRYAQTTPLAYLQRRKINKAIELLSHSQESIKQIALQLGFSNQYVFSKVFRRLMHCPPSAWRLRDDPATPSSGTTSSERIE